MALEIAKAAVVRDDLEAIANRLPAPAGAVSPVRALARQRGDQLGALEWVEGIDAAADVGLPNGR